jgi:hypothetical protein
MKRSKQSGVENGVMEHRSNGRKRIGFAHIGTGTSRLGPDNSTQVVDFPHLAVASIFLKPKDHRRGAETQRRTELGTQMGNGVLEFWSVGNEWTGSGAHGVHALPRAAAQFWRHLPKQTMHLSAVKCG